MGQINISKERIQEALDSGAQILTTSCPFCIGNLSDAYKEMGAEIQEKIQVNLKGLDKKAMIELRKSLEANKFNEDSLYEEFYNISKKIGIDTKQFFKDVYMILINKEKGPRLAGFIITLGQDKVIKLLKQIK